MVDSFLQKKTSDFFLTFHFFIFRHGETGICCTKLYHAEQNLGFYGIMMYGTVYSSVVT